MVFDALGIEFSVGPAHPQRDKKIQDNAVSGPCFFGQKFPLGRQKDGPVWFGPDQSCALEAGNRIGDGDLADTQAGSDFDGASFPGGMDEFVDQLDVVLSQFSCVIRASAAVAADGTDRRPASVSFRRFRFLQYHRRGL